MHLIRSISKFWSRGVIGSHASLRNLCRKTCRFESDRDHYGTVGKDASRSVEEAGRAASRPESEKYYGRRRSPSGEIHNYWMASPRDSHQEWRNDPRVQDRRRQRRQDRFGRGQDSLRNPHDARQDRWSSVNLILDDWIEETNDYPDGYVRSEHPLVYFHPIINPIPIEDQQEVDWLHEGF